jgi:hypothetical protein
MTHRIILATEPNELALVVELWADTYLDERVTGINNFWLEIDGTKCGHTDNLEWLEGLIADTLEDEPGPPGLNEAMDAWVKGR